MIIGVVTLLKVKRVNGYDADDCMEWTQSKWQPLQCLTFASFVPCLYIHVCTVCVCMSSQSIRNHRILNAQNFQCVCDGKAPTTTERVSLPIRHRLSVDKNNLFHLVHATWSFYVSAFVISIEMSCRGVFNAFDGLISSFSFLT